MLQSIVKNSSGNTVPTASTNLAFDQEFDDPWETHSRAGKKKRDDCRQGSNERNCETDIGDTAANVSDIDKEFSKLFYNPLNELGRLHYFCMLSS